LHDEKIIKIYLIGSSVKGEFGEYEPPGFRGSLFSDFDFIIFVEDDYIIPDLEKEPDGRPFPDDSLNLAYRIRKYIQDKYDAEIFFVRRSTMEDKQIQKLAQAKGCEIPFDEKSTWPYIVVYQR
jgi:predicted nucleotidyltransferase